MHTHIQTPKHRGSASSSEVLAISLASNRPTTIIGERTFGKALVQHSYTLADGSVLKVWHTYLLYVYPDTYTYGHISIVEHSHTLPDGSVLKVWRMYVLFIFTHIHISIVRNTHSNVAPV